MRQAEIFHFNTVYPLNRIPYAVGKELSLENDARTIGRALPYLNACERHAKVHSYRAAVQDGMDQWYMRQQLELALEAVQDDCEGYAERRQSELVLADYIESMKDKHRFAYYGNRLDALVESMRACRQGGTVGLKPDGGHVVAWDSKCGNSRLCPDESREEQQRLESKYLPHMMAWQRGSDYRPGESVRDDFGKYHRKRGSYESTGNSARRRLFYAVINPPNAPAGNLHEYKRELSSSFAAMLRDRVEQSAAEKMGSGSRAKWRPVFPSLKGALVVQEDPLSQHGDWNVHLNVILAVEGAFSYKDFRAWWTARYPGGCQVEINELKRNDARGVAASLRELIKYSAAPIAGKAEAKYRAGTTAAPPMTMWPHERFIEWWQAGKAFRRTRSYGAFYKVPEADTGTLGGVTWVGKLEFQRDGSYWVDLILEDNFSSSGHSPRNHNFSGVTPPPTGPP